MIAEIMITITITTGIINVDFCGGCPFPASSVGGGGGAEKLETKLNEVFDGLDKIDKVGIGPSLNPVPKQIFFFKKCKYKFHIILFI